jgi:hypothetical protein
LLTFLYYYYIILINKTFNRGNPMFTNFLSTINTRLTPYTSALSSAIDPKMAAGIFAVATPLVSALIGMHVGPLLPPLVAFIGEGGAQIAVSASLYCGIAASLEVRTRCFASSSPSIELIEALIEEDATLKYSQAFETASEVNTLAQDVHTSYHNGELHNFEAPLPDTFHEGN